MSYLEFKSKSCGAKLLSLGIVLALAIGVIQPAQAQASAAKSSSIQSAKGLSSLPTDAQGPISAALGKDDSGYWLHHGAVGFRGVNPKQGLAVEFTRQGAAVQGEARSKVRGDNRSDSHNLRWVLETRGCGYGDALHRVEAVDPQAKANRVEYRREGITEWYENGPMGLEQGFTLAQPPGNANGQPLTIELGLNGTDIPLKPKPGLNGAPSDRALDAEGKILELRGTDGRAGLRYTGLMARDAAGRELRSWMEIRGERLLVRVSDAGARYPVVVDPWIQQAELTASDGAAGDFLGYSVAVDGTTAVVGAPNHTTSGTNQSQGAAYVFVENGGTWSQQAELTGPTNAQGDLFGQSVAVSGSIALVGAPSLTVGSNPVQGAAYVFVRNGTSWSQQAQLVASDGATGDQFGQSVAVSGSTAVVGAQEFYSNGPGAAYVFAQSGTTWSQEAKLTASNGQAGDWFGTSVAVVAGVALVGAPNHPYSSSSDQPGPGAAYVFAGSGKTWSQQAELSASDAVAGDIFGGSVALSGSTGVVGAPNHTVNSNSSQGAAYVFAQSGTTWSQQAELTSSNGAPGDDFGISVAISGGTLLVGAWSKTVGSNASQGAAYVFAQSGTTWSQQAELTASDGGADDYFGFAVAVSGSTAVVGANGHTVGSNPDQGAAYVFVPPSTSVTLSPASLSFGNEAVNNTSAAKMVTLTNSSSSTLDISNIDITPSTNFKISSKTCGSTLAVGKSCKVSVEFEPTALGALKASLVFTDNAPGSPQSVPLSGTGVEPATLTPTSASFGKHKVGTTSASKTFTLTNEQNGELTGITVSTSGDTADFLYSTSCGASLAAKGKCTISVKFKPTEKGTRTGELSVSDNASNSPQKASLSGTGD